MTELRSPFEPLPPGACHVPNTNQYRLKHGMSAHDLAETIADRIEFEGPDTVSAVILEPVQNAGGCLTPPDGYFQRVREICDEYDVVMISDEVICAWGRLGEWFGAQRYDYEPDIITTAKGLTSSYAAMGAVIASDQIAQPFIDSGSASRTGSRSAAIRWPRPWRSPTSTRSRTDHVFDNVRSNEPMFREMLDSLRDLPIVGDIRGAGYFHAIELVKDKETKQSFSHEEAEVLLRGYLSRELYSRGLICRADDRGDPVIQLSPPLIAGPEQFTEIESILRPVLTEAGNRMHVHGI